MKWIITCRLPSGAKFAWAQDREEGCFALTKLEGDVVKRASCWDTKQEAEAHIQEQLACAPELEKLAPFTVEQCMVLGQG